MVSGGKLGYKSGVRLFYPCGDWWKADGVSVVSDSMLLYVFCMGLCWCISGRR